MKATFKKIIIILIGQFISAAAFNLILIPNNLVAVGFGGVATVVNVMTGANIQLVLSLLAAPVILWSFFKYDRKQVFYAALCYGTFTFYIGIVKKLFPVFVTDPIIASVAGGILLGISTGMILRQGVANGPEAVVGLYLKEKKDLSIGSFFMILNTVIIFSSILYGDLTLIIYSLISNYIASKVTDVVVIGTERYYIVNIMSEHYLDITEYVQQRLKRGVTFVQGMDADNVKKQMFIETVVSSGELVLLKEYIKSLKDNSFVYVTESAGLIGKGFDK